MFQNTIDDFEGSQSAIDIRTFNNWVLSSLPQGQPDLFPEASLYNDLNYGKNRAKMSWYVVDPSIFYARGFNNVVNLLSKYGTCFVESSTNDLITFPKHNNE